MAGKLSDSQHRLIKDYLDRTDLNDRQKAFILKKFELGNATEAARQAGYSAKYAGTNADKLLKNTKIGEAIREIEKEITLLPNIASMAEVMAFFTSVLRGEVTEEAINPVTGMREEMPVGTKIRLDAGKELARRYPRDADITDTIKRLEAKKLEAEIKNLKAGKASGASNVIIIHDDIESRLNDGVK